jgi:hypothetical protein
MKNKRTKMKKIETENRNKKQKQKMKTVPETQNLLEPVETPTGMFY